MPSASHEVGDGAKDHMTSEVVKPHLLSVLRLRFVLFCLPICHRNRHRDRKIICKTPNTLTLNSFVTHRF